MHFSVQIRKISHAKCAQKLSTSDSEMMLHKSAPTPAPLSSLAVAQRISYVHTYVKGFTVSMCVCVCVGACVCKLYLPFTFYSTKYFLLFVVDLNNLIAVRVCVCVDVHIYACVCVWLLIYLCICVCVCSCRRHLHKTFLAYYLLYLTHCLSILLICSSFFFLFIIIVVFVFVF